MGAFSLDVNPHQLSCYHNELIRLSIKGNTLFSERKPCPLANKKYQNILRNSDNDTDDVCGLQMLHPAIPDGRTWRTQRTWKDGKPKKNAVGRTVHGPAQPAVAGTPSYW